MRTPTTSTILLTTFISIAYAAAVPDPVALPFSLAADEKYYPHDTSALSRRQSNDVSQNMPPVMKLYGVENEKFFFSSINDIDQDFPRYGNETFRNHRPPARALRVEIVEEEKKGEERWMGWLAMGRRSGLVRRQSNSCSAGYSSCLNINQPLDCCPTGTVCESITNTGFGSVGCCPTGEQCSGNLANCLDGYTKCVNENGGGCCQPGEVCGSSGCVATLPVLTTMPAVATGLDICSFTGWYPCPSSLSYGCCQIGRLCGVSNCPINTGTGTPGIEYLTATAPGATAVSFSPAVVATVVTSTIESISVETIAVTPAVVPVTLLSTIVTTTTAIAPTTTNTVLITNVITATSTPATVSVLDESTITTSNPVATTTVTASQDPDVKETDAAGGIIIASSGESCPTGYYSCAAIFSGGCCRNGRNCGVTDCPAATTSLTSQSAISGVITSATTTTTSSADAGAGDSCTTLPGVYACPASLNGGCCPTGYLCALSNCPASTLVGSNGILETVAPTGAATTSKDGGKSPASRAELRWTALGAVLMASAWLVM